MIAQGKALGTGPSTSMKPWIPSQKFCKWQPSIGSDLSPQRKQGILSLFPCLRCGLRSFLQKEMGATKPCKGANACRAARIIAPFPGLQSGGDVV